MLEQYEKLRPRNAAPAALVIGGMSEQRQIQAVHNVARVVVATPGRLEDYLRRKLVDLRRVETLVAYNEVISPPSRWLLCTSHVVGVGTPFSPPHPPSLLRPTRVSLEQRLFRHAAVHARTPDMQMENPRSTTESAPKKSVLLLDSKAERRALRKKILGLHGIDVIGASDLTEAGSIWRRGCYDLVLIDIRRDYYGCVAWRNEIKKESPKQLVAFLVGQPEYLNLEPGPNSYVAEEPGAEWSDSFRRAVRQACSSLPQRNGFEEVGFRIAMARKVRGLPPTETRVAVPADDPPDEVTYNPSDDTSSLSPLVVVTQLLLSPGPPTETENE